jgi:hypothetical protein
LPTERVGNDIYQAHLYGPGTYVLVRAGRGGVFGIDPTVFALAAVVLALAAVIIVVRVRRRRAIPDDSDPADDGDATDDGDAADSTGPDGPTAPTEKEA